MKQVAVLGMGEFGAALVRQLQHNRVSVLAVDISRARVEALKDMVDRIVIADFTQASALERLALNTMDAVVIAASTPMTASVLAVLRLKDLGVERIIAKAENEDHAKILQALGVREVVIPEEDSAARVATKISWTKVNEIVELSSECSIMEVSPPDAVIGKTLRTSGLRSNYHVEVLGIRETVGGRLIAIPNPDTIIQAGSTLVVFGEDKDLEILRKDVEGAGG